MPRTIQIRDLDDDVYLALRKKAASAGLTVPEFLRQQAALIASRPSVEEWLARTARRTTAVISPQDVVDALDETRGPWNNAGS